MLVPVRVEADQPHYLEVKEPVVTVASTIEERPLTIEEKIRSKAVEYGYSPDRAVAIAKAESGLVPNAKNASSSASGLFQFINGTFNAFCIDGYKLTDSMDQKNDPDIQIECALRMLSEGGEGHWSESKAGWGHVK